MLQARKNLEANDVTLRLLNNQKLPQVDLQTRYATTGIGGTRLITEGTGVDRGEIIGIEPGRLSRRAGHALPQQAADVEHGAEHQLQPRHERGRRIDRAGAHSAESDRGTAPAARSAGDERRQQRRDPGAEQRRARAVGAGRARSGAAALDAENSKFGVGMSTNYKVVLAQRDLANAQNNELQAVLTYRKAVVDFERMQQTGTGGNITVISR